MNHAYRQSQAFFESRYQAASDPWDFASSEYELDRYDTTLAVLSKPRYRRAYEPGCSIGVLTAALSKRCGQLVACDLSHGAVQRARQRCVDCGNVEIFQRDAADETPPGTYDLIVFSELGYYFSAARLGVLARQLAMRLEPGGEFVAVHWLGRSTDHLLHGDEVHEVLAANLACELIGGTRRREFRIDAWRHAA